MKPSAYLEGSWNENEALRARLAECQTDRDAALKREAALLARCAELERALDRALTYMESYDRSAGSAVRQTAINVAKAALGAKP